MTTERSFISIKTVNCNTFTLLSLCLQLHVAKALNLMSIKPSVWLVVKGNSVTKRVQTRVRTVQLAKPLSKIEPMH